MTQKITVHTSGFIIIENSDMEPRRLTGSYALAVDKIYCVSPFQYESEGEGVVIYVDGSEESFNVDLPLITVLNAICDARRMRAIDLKHI
jgi:hypothetical protein